VYDATAYSGTTVTPQVFVADSGGYLYAFNASNGASVGQSGQLAASGSAGIVDGPIVDPAAGTVYVFIGQDGNTSTSQNCGSAAGCDGVFRFSIASGATASNGLAGTGSGLCSSTNGTSWTSGSVCGVESVMGVGASTLTIYDGTFDNTYLTGTGSTGNLWTCSANSGVPRLSRSPMSGFGSTLSPASNGLATLASGAAACSPVSEIDNNGTDYLFLSVSANGNQTGVGCNGSGAAGACLYSISYFNFNTYWFVYANAGIAATSGSSGIIIDNTSGSAGASQVYYSPLGSQSCTTSGGTGGCAVQASQANLQ
jgi:hypothetical protein